MKVTIIDQQADTVHELAQIEAPKTDETSTFSWFDPYEILSASQQFLLVEDEPVPANSRVRFADGREIEVDCETGDLVGV